MTHNGNKHLEIEQNSSGPPMSCVLFIEALWRNYDALMMHHTVAVTQQCWG